MSSAPKAIVTLSGTHSKENFIVRNQAIDVIVWRIFKNIVFFMTNSRWMTFITGIKISKTKCAT